MIQLNTMNKKQTQQMKAQTNAIATLNQSMEEEVLPHLNQESIEIGKIA